MAQVSAPQHFCAQCGASITHSAYNQQQSCPHCGTEFDARYHHIQGQQDLADAEATIRVAARSGLVLRSDRQHDPTANSDATERVSTYNPTADTDATERASTQFLTHLYTRAMQQDALTPVAEHSPLERKLQFVALVKKMHKYTRNQWLARISCGVGALLLLSHLVMGIAS